MKAVMYGGGNIGRGFIGLLFRQSGYEVSFIDIAQPVIEGLNSCGEYPVRIVSSDGYDDICVDKVRAVDGNDMEACAEVIAAADIMATAVGVNVLKHIVPNLVAGIRKRFSVTNGPLNIIICENLIDANKLLAGMIKEHLTKEEVYLFNQRIGLVEASVGRMVPIQTEVMKDGNPLRVCVERYGWLPVDKDAIKGPVPNIKGIVAYSPFSFYIKRKLFIHNMGHALCAYLGLYTGYQYIWQAINNPDIFILVKNAMLESARALAAEYDLPILLLLSHIDDLLVRFSNRALGDTCARVGSDPLRKLGFHDRLTGAAMLCETHGIRPRHIAVGVAVGIHRSLLEEKKPQTFELAQDALYELCGIDIHSQLAMRILMRYLEISNGTSPQQLRITIQHESIEDGADVV